jgi:hypothetical protein
MSGRGEVAKRKIEDRAVVRPSRAEGLSESEIRRGLASVYGQNVFSRNEVFVW